MMRTMVALAALLALGACAAAPEPPVAAAPPAPRPEIRFARTVDGFLVPAVKPTRQVALGPIAEEAELIAAAPAAARAAPVPRTLAPRKKSDPSKVAPFPVAAGVVDLDVTQLAYPPSVSCSSVVLFSQRPIEKPAKEVPEAWTRFLGQWGNGAWDGVVCHDLRVLEVRADGSATVVSMHAPYEPWRQAATAYTREARFVANDRLLVANGASTRIYWIDESGAMRAVRRNPEGYVTATLSKKKR